MDKPAAPAFRLWLHAGQAALLASVYYAAAKLALLLAIDPGYATPIWPASGIALAALCAFGNRLWPGVWIGSAMANLSIEGAFFVAAAIATGSTLQVLVLASLLRRHIGIPYRFATVQQVVQFVVLCAFGAILSSTIALLALSSAHPLSGGEAFRNWWTWWQGDASGLILLTPLLLSWRVPGTVAWTRRKALELAAFVVLLVLATHAVFGEGGLDAPAFVLVPFIVWTAFRFGQREVASATAVLCVMAVAYTLSGGIGPFASRSQNEALLLLLTFISTLVFMGMAVSAVLRQLERAMAALRKRQGELEARVHERTRQLSESEQRFRLMVESVVDYAIFMLDARGRVTSWNAGAERILGYRAEEIVGHSLAVSRQELELAEVVGRFDEEAWRTRKDGSTFWASVAVTAVRDEGGRLLGFAKVVRDLTERNRVETDLIRAKVAAEKASEAKSQFLANMSHELRTPLNSLLILARLLADNVGGNLSPKQVQFAQTIQAAGLDLLSLINDLLDLAKIESGAITALNVAPAGLAELRDELERAFGQIAQEKGLQFSVAIEPGLPATVRTDALRLKQVLKNLLANAFKFTRQGSVTLRIAPAAPGSIAFRVIDTGIGIPAEKQQVIFEAFQQADGTTSRQYGGTGLGLSISRELTRLLGGDLRLTSEPGQGSAFILTLPLADERATAPA